MSVIKPGWAWGFPHRWQERHDEASLRSPQPLHPTCVSDQAIPPIKAQGLVPAGLRTRRLLQPVKEKGWRTPPGAPGMPRLSFTLLEGGGDVVDAVVVGADTRS